MKIDSVTENEEFILFMFQLHVKYFPFADYLIAQQFLFCFQMFQQGNYELCVTEWNRLKSELLLEYLAAQVWIVFKMRMYTNSYEEMDKITQSYSNNYKE